METLSGVLVALYAFGVLALVWNLIRSLHLITKQRTLPPLQDDTRSWPSLDVVVPVKDEEAHVATCLESIIAQNYPNMRITVLNDRSTDGTVAAVQKIQDAHPEIRRVDIQELPEGMYGKPHAIHSIAEDLKADVIAFIDSDLTLQPGCLQALVQHLEDKKLDWVATMGGPALFKFWEHLIIPLFGAITFAWYDPRKISDPAWKDAIGSAFMICRREAYEAVGGHGAVIDIYDEDSELIRIVKRAGQRVSFVLTPELFTQRHYGSLASTIRGLTRTCIGGIKTIPRLLFTIQSLSFVSHMPFFVLLAVGVGAWMGQPIPFAKYWFIAAIAHVFVALGLAWIVFSTAGTKRRFALLHPIGTAILMGICMRAIKELRRGARITWRGTTYQEG